MYTKSTPNYALPQWQSGQHPEFIGDLNPALLKIDTELKTMDVKAESAEQLANSANTLAGNAQIVAVGASEAVALLDAEVDLLKADVTALQNSDVVINNRITAVEEALSEIDLSGEVDIWENLNPNVAFAGQSITLSESLSNFRYYKLIGKLSATGGNSVYHVETGKIPVGMVAWFNATINKSYGRAINSASGTIVAIGDSNLYNFDNTTVLDNSTLIPLKIVGYR